MTDREQKEIFSKNLNRLIENSGKQQKEVALEMDIAPTTLNNWCVGLSLPKYGKITKLAEYFKCDVSDLVDECTKLSMEMEIEKITKSLSEEQKERLLEYAKMLKSYKPEK